jgi:hypothetical protein
MENVYFEFWRGDTKLEDIQELSYDECLKITESFPIDDFERFYNDEDNSDVQLEYLVRLFSSSQNCVVYMVTKDESHDLTYTDGQPCTFSGQSIYFEDGRNDVWLRDIPVEILDALCEELDWIRKVDLAQFEDLYNREEFPLYITIRES